jgi:transcriptional regulator with GAF, ATPase, and Fis domain
MDIPILVRRYFPSIEFEEDALDLLCHYTWPGNVRELLATVECRAAKVGCGQIITTDHVRR